MTSFLISAVLLLSCFFFFSSRRRHTRCSRDWSSDVCSSDLTQGAACNSGTSCMQNWAQWNVYYAESVNGDRKSTRLNSSHGYISYAVFCLKKKKPYNHTQLT